jgi:hypothetical protein
VEIGDELFGACLPPGGATPGGALELCSGKGHCHEGICECAAGFGEVHCESMHCAISPVNSVECGVYGSCNKTTGNCTCVVGRTGETCDFAVNCGDHAHTEIPHALSTCVGNTAYDGDPCLTECDEGFSRGSMYFTCGADGVWQGELECAAELDCAAPDDAVVANIDPDRCDAITESGNGCTYAYKPGYHSTPGGLPMIF